MENQVSLLNYLGLKAINVSSIESEQEHSVIGNEKLCLMSYSPSCKTVFKASKTVSVKSSSTLSTTILANTSPPWLSLKLSRPFSFNEKIEEIPWFCEDNIRY